MLRERPCIFREKKIQVKYSNFLLALCLNFVSLGYDLDFNRSITQKKIYFKLSKQHVFYSHMFAQIFYHILYGRPFSVSYNRFIGFSKCIVAIYSDQCTFVYRISYNLISSMDWLKFVY